MLTGRLAVSTRHHDSEPAMITAEYDWRWSGCPTPLASVNPDAEAVTFYDCHQANRFWSLGCDAENTCPLAEVRGTCWNLVRGHGWVLEVVTPAGRAFLPARAAGFEAVWTAIRAGLPPGAGLRWYEYRSTRILMLLVLVFSIAIPATVLLVFIFH
jgi:hypothetical protein